VPVAVACEKGSAAAVSPLPNLGHNGLLFTNH